MFINMILNSDNIQNEEYNGEQTYNDYIDEQFSKNKINQIDPLYYINVDSWLSANLTQAGADYFNGITDDDSSLLATDAVGEIGKDNNIARITFKIFEDQFKNKKLEIVNITCTPVLNKTILGLYELGILKHSGPLDLNKFDLNNLEKYEDNFILTRFNDSIDVLKRLISLVIDVKDNL